MHRSRSVRLRQASLPCSARALPFSGLLSFHSVEVVRVATFVLVHGIGQEQPGPAALRQRWRTELSDGVWKAGDNDLAERLEQPERADASGRAATRTAQR